MYYYTYANKAGATAIEEAVKNKGEKSLFLEDYVAIATKGVKQDYLKALACFSGNKWSLGIFI